MSRRKSALQRRVFEGDFRYGDETVTRFINYLMKNGKKSVAEKIFYGAMDLINEKKGFVASSEDRPGDFQNQGYIQDEGLRVFRDALENVSPQLEVRSRRVGGVTYQVPVEVRPERMRTLAIRWLVRYARQRNDKSMIKKLAAELMDAQKGMGGAVKKKDDTRKMAEANKAFSHYRW